MVSRYQNEVLGLSWSCVVNCQRCSAWHPDGFLLVTHDDDIFDVYKVTTSPDFNESEPEDRRIVILGVSGDGFPMEGWRRLNPDGLLKELQLL